MSCSMIVIEISNVVATATLTGESQHGAVTCIAWCPKSLISSPARRLQMHAFSHVRCWCVDSQNVSAWMNMPSLLRSFTTN